MTTASAYETLYNNMKTKFTVTNDNGEYTLGEYMSIKANEKRTSSLLPATSKHTNKNTIAAVFSYVNDKLKIKKAPEKDKTMRSFPFRTSFAAFLSAVVACALIFSYGIFTVGNKYSVAPTVDAHDDIVEEQLVEDIVAENE